LRVWLPNAARPWKRVRSGCDNTCRLSRLLWNRGTLKGKKLLNMQLRRGCRREVRRRRRREKREKKEGSRE
jgi:hypothetical protein